MHSSARAMTESVDPFHVRVSAVELQPRRPGLIQSLFLEAPRVKDWVNGSVLTIVGWFIPGDGILLARALIVHQGKVLKRTLINIPRPDVLGAIPAAAGTCVGFHCELSLLGLSKYTELEIIVSYDDKQFSERQRLLLYKLVVEKKSKLMVESKYQPVQVTAIGRSGTTLLMQVLNQHPQVLTTNFYPYEVKLATYWLQLLKVVAAPADLECSSHPDQFEGTQESIGHNPYSHPEYIGQYKLTSAIRNYYDVSVVRSIAQLVVGKINEYYEIVAEEEGKLQAKYFAEKSLPNHINALCADVFDHPKEIILTRDFRDIICSARAFNEKRKTKAFGRDTVADDFEWVDVLANSGARRMQQAWLERKGHSLHVKYEDLILDPEHEISRILNYLDVENGPSTVAGIRQAVFSDVASVSKHKTTENPSLSIGRWRTDMDDNLKAHCKLRLGEVLDTFGYEV
ncbi:MAG: sulfotransferase [Pseudomonas sp.]|uniref:sulfotransferase family protein n=1 Tax=Pseudomonas sp. TaxID=306 RepID=UPI003394743E